VGEKCPGELVPGVSYTRSIRVSHLRTQLKSDHFRARRTEGMSARVVVAAGWSWSTRLPLKLTPRRRRQPPPPRRTGADGRTATSRRRAGRPERCFLSPCRRPGRPTSCVPTPRCLTLLSEARHGLTTSRGRPPDLPGAAEDARLATRPFINHIGVVSVRTGRATTGSPCGTWSEWVVLLDTENMSVERSVGRAHVKT